MVIGIILSVLLFGTLFYFQRKSKKKASEPTYVVNKNYVSVSSNLTKFEEELLFHINKHRLDLYSGLTGTIITIDDTDEGARVECHNHIKYLIQLQIDNQLDHDPENDKDSANHNGYPDRQLQMFRNGAKSVGEVVSYGYSSSKGTINGYLRSDSHRRVLEELGWTHVGIRALRNPKGRYFTTLIFYK